MPNRDRKLVSATGWSMAALAFAVALVLPAGYFSINYTALASATQTEAEIQADELSKIVINTPETWKFQEHRLSELLLRRKRGIEDNSARILDQDGAQVVSVGTSSGFFGLRRSAGLFDAGVLVGKVEQERSLRDLFLKTAGVALLSSLLGITMFAMLWRAEARERRVTANLAAIVGSANDAIVSRSADGSILSWNKAAERLFGWSAQEAIGQPITIIVPPERRGEVRPFIERVMRGETVAPVETLHRHRDGSLIDTSVTFSQTRDTAGNIVSLSFIYRDISKRKQIENALRESEQLFRAIFDHAGIGIAIRPTHDRHRRWTRVNDRFCELLGYTKEELLGLSTADITPLDGHERAIADNQRLLNGEVENYTREKQIIRKDGRKIWVILTVAVLPDVDGRRHERIAIYQDITARKQAEEEIRRSNENLEQKVKERTSALERSNEELATFTYSVAHDLRTPLRAINGFSAFILDAGKGNKFDLAMVDDIKRVRAASERMGAVIDDLLSLTRLTRQEMKWQWLDLSQIVASIVAPMTDAHPQRDVSVTILPSMSVHGDSSLIQVMLENLISNAWKFTAKIDAARIEIGTEKRDGKAVYYVRDNGAGFDMKYVHKLFTPFQRLHRSDEFEGTGIGLVTAKRIVQRHQGEIRIESAINLGTTVFFSLGKPV